MIVRVKELFRGHNDLIQGFNTFVPKGYEMKLPEVSRVLTITDALLFIKAVEDKFQDNRGKYNEILKVFKDFKDERFRPFALGSCLVLCLFLILHFIYSFFFWFGRIDTDGVVMRVTKLFRGHGDLFQMFCSFLPTGYEIKLPEEKKPLESGDAISFANKVEVYIDMLSG